MIYPEGTASTLLEPRDKMYTVLKNPPSRDPCAFDAVPSDQWCSSWY